MIFFTADQHFGHANIIKFCDRPFVSVVDMDAKMVCNWNEIVGAADTVYHLGDFTLGGVEAAESYFSQLNGNVYVLDNYWHHDRRWIRSAEDRFKTATGGYVRLVVPLYVLEFKPPIVLCHYPIARWDRCHYGSWHLFGHTHGRYKGARNSLDVGVDVWDYRPVSLAQIRDTLTASGSD